jgi:hypothetical protein
MIYQPNKLRLYFRICICHRQTKWLVEDHIEDVQCALMTHMIILNNCGSDFNPTSWIKIQPTIYTRLDDY